MDGSTGGVETDGARPPTYQRQGIGEILLAAFGWNIVWGKKNMGLCFFTGWESQTRSQVDKIACGQTRLMGQHRSRYRFASRRADGKSSKGKVSQTIGQERLLS